MDLHRLYPAHLDEVAKASERALARAATAGAKYDGIVFHAGTQAHYHADDREVAFQTIAHFGRFAPVGGPHHLLHFRPGETPHLVRVIARDYWYEPPVQPDHPYAEVLRVSEAGSADEAARVLEGAVGGCAFFGDDPAVAARLGLDAAAIEPAALAAPLDWERAYKTPYEVECVREAGRIAGLGHRAVREGVAQGWSERRLHAAYLEATGALEHKTPYTNIIDWDEHAAILHYQSKELDAPSPGHTFLIDAGAAFLGYASDVTRTYVREGVHPVFVQALDAMDAMQRDLVAKTRDGVDYVELHATAQRGVADILSDVGVSKLSGAETFERGLSQPFFPHGLGHHIGLQVHDVGGRQVAPEGGVQAPPESYPFLRTTRRLEAGQVVTIEPGLYFIPMLLEPLRTGPDAGSLDWDLIDALVPCGGIRVEDDVRVTAEGGDDLTRPFIPGHTA